MLQPVAPLAQPLSHSFDIKQSVSVEVGFVLSSISERPLDRGIVDNEDPLRNSPSPSECHWPLFEEVS